MTISIYQLKPRFQALLRPIVRRLAAAGVTANMVTVAAMLISCVLGAVLFVAEDPRLFLLLPPWMFLRMALNAIDGMLAREFGQKSALGAYLNELTDVVSDAALYLPFATFPELGAAPVGLVIFLATLSEMTGVVAVMTGASRRYDGPMGKSDRAFVFGALGLWLGLAGSLPAGCIWLLLGVSVLIALNIVNRVRGGLAELRSAPDQRP